MKHLRILGVIVTLVAAFAVTRLRLSTDLTELFPRSAEAEMLARVTRVFGGGDVALVLVRAKEPRDAERAARDAAIALRGCGAVARVLEEAPVPAPKRDEAPDPTSAWRWAGPTAREKLAQALTEEGMRRRLRDTRALLLAPGSSDVAETLARDPLRLMMIPFEGRMELAAGARSTGGGAFVADEGRARLLVVEPRGRAFDSAAAARFTHEAEAALDVTRRTHPRASLSLTGGHVIAKQTEALMRGDLQKSGVLSGVLASLVFVAMFRRPRALLAVLPPLAAGTLWTTALAVLLYPRLSSIAIAFAAVVVGVGVDTGVHVYGRLLAARREGLSPSEAAIVARRETWRPTLGAAVAAGGAFACLGLSDIAGMRQLGMLCAAGEVLTALAILLVVPEVGAWLERGHPPPPLRLPVAATLTATRPRALSALAIATGSIAGALAIGAPALDHGVVALDGAALPAVATYDEIYATFGGTKGQLVIVSADRDEARARARADAVAEVAETLAANGTIEGFDALGTIAPSSAAQRARLAMRDALDLPSKKALLARVLAEEGFAADAFAPALEALEHPSTDVREIRGADESALAWVERRHLGKDDAGTLAVTFVRLGEDPTGAEIARATLRAADPEAVLTGFAALESSLRETLSRDLPRVLVAAGAMVILVLGLSLKRASAVLLAALVLVVEIALVLLLSRIFGVTWHVYDALVLPVLLGITLDEALFLLEAAKHKSIDEALSEQAPLAAATALTTAAGFGALMVCRFGGLADVGKVGALGSVAGLVCALVVIPAGFRVVASRRRSP